MRRPLLSLKPKVNTAWLGIKPSNSRQSTRALNTNSSAWKAIRERVLKRDLYRCQGYPKGKHVQGCNGIATEVDHIDGDSGNDTPDMSNYAAMSKPCHSAKTAREQGGFGNV